MCNRLHLSDVQEPGGHSALECFLRCWQLLESVPSEEEPGALNKPVSHGTAVAVAGIVSTLSVKPLFHSSYWQEMQSCCSMARVPTSQGFGGV